MLYYPSPGLNKKKLRPTSLGVKSTLKVNLRFWGDFNQLMFLYNVLRVREFIPATAKGVRLTDDLQFKVT